MWHPVRYVHFSRNTPWMIYFKKYSIQQGQVGQRCVLLEWKFFLWMNVFMKECFFMNECCLWMNEWFNEWIIQCMLLLLSWYEFSDEKMQDSDAFYECVTDRPTDTAYCRDARTQLKM